MKDESVNEGELPFEEETAEELEARALRARMNQRRVLLGVGLFILIGLGLQLAAPLLAPLAIREGPMVQQLTETSAVFVWTQTHDVPTVFQLTTASGESREVPITRDGDHQRAEVTDLAPAHEYEYTISANGKELVSARFRSARPRGQAFSFIAFGDSGRATQAQFRIGARIAGQHPDFVVHTGDVVYPDGARDDYYQRFFQPYRTILREAPIWPSLGNHDFDSNGGGPYREVFDLPRNGPKDQAAEDNYWFDYADARFVIINSNIPEAALRDSIAPWVREVFAAPDTPAWRFAVLHHPPYTAGKHRPSETVVRTLVPVFEAAGVAVVFCGHDHLYERSKPLRGGQIVDSGVVYIVSGAGGADLYSFKSPDHQPEWLAAGRDDVHSFTSVNVDGDRITIRQIDIDGNTIDEASWTR